MKKEIEEKVRKHLQKKRSFQVVSVVFGFVALLLFLVSTQEPVSERFWINFPSFILMGVLGIIYVGMFGVSTSAISDPYEEDDEIDKEVARIYQAKTEGLEPRLDLDQTDRLELEELERIRTKAEKD
jgi:hypothetical protein